MLSLRRELDSDNNAPCFSLAGLVWLSAARHRTSRKKVNQYLESQVAASCITSHLASTDGIGAECPRTVVSHYGDGY